MIRTGLLATLIAAIIMGGICFWTITSLPTTGEVPIHWNAKGEADGFASPEEARHFVWIMPGITILVSLILAVGAKIDPRQKNIERSGRAYLAVWISMLVFMVFISGFVSYSMVKGSVDSEVVQGSILSIIVSSISVLYIIIGNYLPKTRSNWFFGIRTPWTLSSEVTWAKTHRVAGRLFIIMGLLGIISVFLAPLALQIGFLVVGALIITAFSLIYSYVIWRDAPDRVTAADYVE